MMHEMSPLSNWPGDRDRRQSFYKNILSNVLSIVGPSYEETIARNVDLSNLNLKKYSLIVIDDNMAKPDRGTVQLIQKAKKYNVTVVGCPHGNREYDRSIVAQVPDYFDYSFVFGKKDIRFLETKRKRGRLIPGGIPANDILNECEKTSEYILVIPGFTGHANVGKYHGFTKKVFDDAGIVELQQKYACPVVIKEKSSAKKNKISCKFAKHYDNVSTILDVIDDNSLITGAKMVIGSPSTLCFKSIQIGIPTVLIKGTGMLGAFYDFPGLAESPVDVVRAMDEQIAIGKYSDFVEDTLEGGIDFSSTQIYIDHISELAERYKR
jgi:hypothetical protein